MTYKWGATQSKAVPLDWVSDRSELAKVIVPPIDKAQAPIWLVSLLLDSFSSNADITTSVDSVLPYNNRAFPIAVGDPDREYYFPLKMLRPELERFFVIPNQTAVNGLAAYSATGDLATIEATQPGAYRASAPSIGTVWDESIYRSALAGVGGGTLILQPDVRFYSEPVTVNKVPNDPYFFVSPSIGAMLDPMTAVPIAQSHYEKLSTRDDAVSGQSTVQLKPLVVIVGLVLMYVVYVNPSILEEFQK